MHLEPFHGPIYVVARDGRVRVFDTIADAHEQLEPETVEDGGIRPGSQDPNAPAYLRKVLGRKHKVF